MRVFVIEQDGAGGLVHYAYQLCSALQDSGAEVTLVTGRHYELADLPHSFRVEPRIGLWSAVGITLPDSRIRSLLTRLGRKARRPLRAIRYAWEWKRLTDFVIAEHPDIVQLSIIRFPFQRFFLRRMKRNGLVLSQICHEFEPRERGRLVNRIHHRANREVFRTIDLVFLHGESNRELFHTLYPGIARSATRSIPHGDESLFTSGEPTAAPERPTALFFGGLRPSKGIEDLIDAWEQVRYEIDARLVICGEPAGVDPAELRDRTERVGVAVSVDIDPTYQPMERVPELISGASVVVLPYRTATASGVLQLAYAFGRPVVATATGALAEDVEDGSTGLLVAPGDIDGLARALVKILGDRELAAHMGDNAHRAATERFGWHGIAARITAEYEELLG
jgi:glycosyltransferase involved in cell wall biosynthesis